MLFIAIKEVVLPKVKTNKERKTKTNTHCNYFRRESAIIQKFKKPHYKGSYTTEEASNSN